MATRPGRCRHGRCSWEAVTGPSLPSTREPGREQPLLFIRHHLHVQRTQARSRLPSPFRRHLWPRHPFIKLIFKTASAALILSIAATSPRVPTIASRVTAAQALAARSRRWVFPYPGASDGEQRLRLPSLWEGFGASGSCSRVGSGTRGAQRGRGSRSRTLSWLPASTRGVNE